MPRQAPDTKGHQRSDPNVLDETFPDPKFLSGVAIARQSEMKCRISYANELLDIKRYKERRSLLQYRPKTHVLTLIIKSVLGSKR